MSYCNVAVLRPIAALQLMKIEAPEPRRFARRMGNGLEDAADMPAFKEIQQLSELT